MIGRQQQCQKKFSADRQRQWRVHRHRSVQWLSVLSIFLSISGCVTPSDQQRFFSTNMSAWHFSAEEKVYGRENFALDNRARILVVPAKADAWLMQQGKDLGLKINLHFAQQTYAQLRIWFPNSIFLSQTPLSQAKALDQGRALGVEYLVYPQMEQWEDASGFGLGQRWPGSGGTDHAAAVLTLVDAVSGRPLQNWEIKGRSGLLTMFSDAPSRLVSNALAEWAQHLSGHSNQNTPWLQWF